MAIIIKDTEEADARMTRVFNSVIDTERKPRRLPPD